MFFTKPVQTAPRDTLEQLRLALCRLDKAGDCTAPGQADLRQILVDRVAELEAKTAQAQQESA